MDRIERQIENFIEIGIEVRLQTRVTAIERSSEGLAVRASSNGNDELFKANLVVCMRAGRVPDLEPLDLGRAGVTTAKRSWGTARYAALRNGHTPLRCWSMRRRTAFWERIWSSRTVTR
jgi:pyruvate/2-oxoglutarate dehydrogenase complex dihydrolipoamide dehydrogenase (E3) component